MISTRPGWRLDSPMWNNHEQDNTFYTSSWSKSQATSWRLRVCELSFCGPQINRLLNILWLIMNKSLLYRSNPPPPACPLILSHLTITTLHLLKLFRACKWVKLSLVWYLLKLKVVTSKHQSPKNCKLKLSNWALVSRSPNAFAYPRAPLWRQSSNHAYFSDYSLCAMHAKNTTKTFLDFHNGHSLSLMPETSLSLEWSCQTSKQC